MSIKTKDNYQLLTQAPIHKAIISMALPTMLIMLTTGLYNIADTFFMGKLSTQATAAIGVAFSMMFFYASNGLLLWAWVGQLNFKRISCKTQRPCRTYGINRFSAIVFFGFKYLCFRFNILKAFVYMVRKHPYHSSLHATILRNTIIRHPLLNLLAHDE